MGNKGSGTLIVCREWAGLSDRIIVRIRVYKGPKRRLLYLWRGLGFGVDDLKWLERILRSSKRSHGLLHSTLWRSSGGRVQSRSLPQLIEISFFRTLVPSKSFADLFVFFS